MSTHLFAFARSHTGRMTSWFSVQKTSLAAILILLPVLLAMTSPSYAAGAVKTPVAVSAITTDVPFAIEISKDFWGLYWTPIRIPVVKTAGSKSVAGFDFLVTAGQHHPLETNIPDGMTLFTLEFYSDKPTLEPFEIYPLRFNWNDCGNNAIVSSLAGDTLLVSDNAYEWSEGSSPQSMIAGDVNLDGAIDTGDAIAIINYIFRDEPLLNCPIID